MASNKIQLKRTSVAGRVPTSGQLDVGELAINLVDNRLFTKDGSSNIIDVFGQSLNTTSSVAFANLTLTTLTTNNVIIANTANLSILNAGNTTITGFANVVGIFQTGNTTINGTLGTGNTTITGFANVTGTFQTGGNVTIGTGSHTVGGNVAFNTNTLFVDAQNARIGIGTAAPSTTLDVSGAATISTTLAAGNTTITGFVNATSVRAGNSSVYSSLTGDTLTIGSSVVANTSGLTVTGIANVTSDVAVGGNLVVNGSLTVVGTTTIVNSNIFEVSDNIVVLNADETGSPTANVGFEVNRGTSANVQFVWDEGNDRWAIGNSYVSGTLETTANTTIGGTLITSAAGIRFNDGTTQTTAPLDPIVYAIALG
jgi:predicted acyltransferase (DUF342 family)